MQAAIWQSHKYIQTGDGKEELYDLEVDPDERQNLAAASAPPTQLDYLRTPIRAETKTR